MRPLSSCRPGSAIRRPLSSSNARGANNNNQNFNKNYNTTTNTPDIPIDVGNEASELTTGPALQGNPLKGLLARKRMKNQNKPTINQNNQQSESYKKTLETNFDDTTHPKTKSEENSEIYHELKAWREEHEK